MDALALFLLWGLEQGNPGGGSGLTQEDKVAYVQYLGPMRTHRR